MAWCVGRGLSALLGVASPSYLGRKQFHRWVAPTLRTLKRRNDQLPPEMKAPKPRNTYIEWNYNAELYAFGQRLKEQFNNDLLRQALTEKSYLDQEAELQKQVGIEEPAISLEDNSRLQALGKRVIDEYVRQYLKTVLPKLPVEYLKNIQEYLCSDDILGTTAKLMGADDIVLSAEYPVSVRSLRRVLEALVGALMESSGLSRAQGLVRDFVLAHLSGLDLTPFFTPENPMATLTTLLQSQGRPAPEPRLIFSTAVTTLTPSYQVGIYVDKQHIGTGNGETIETAIEMAALDVLWTSWGISLRSKPFPYNLELPSSASASTSLAS